ncbi:succinylglutamate desuccinylase/aspartoacylase family protein [Bacteriovorax sp. Seq25_V]|uniref:succinylglutamate desuccinylase/aspartoacylase family protein n=1 Tax=Bacteriovorax sp. Seq25_V TaxID=1201288 RepID=UPI00038A18E5|nr:succinylglutamate desuccinylase/aspartoacylase family protein [Bacteriovorax sp. Seq25_V]EQC44373.1 succinylglutamate desuccinylase/aspartoacylase family protein [Bacteriovorax sp. Seq25_V]
MLKKEIISVDQIGSNSLDIYKYTIDQGNPGPTVYIQASVHGAELQGNLVIKNLINTLKSKVVFGKIVLIPLANPFASSQKIGTYTFGRFNPVTGDNWNRNYHDVAKKEKEGTIGYIDFKKFVNENQSNSVEEIKYNFKSTLKDTLQKFRETQDSFGISDNKDLFTTLQLLASEADIVLDLHTGPIATRYLYAPQYLKEKSKDLNFPFTLLIDHEFAGAMDEATFYPWVRLKEELEIAGIAFENTFESYTVELGSEEIIDSKAADIDTANILNFLKARSVINESATIDKTAQVFCHISDYQTYRATRSGLCEYLIAPGMSFKKGDLLMRIYQFDNLDLEVEKQQHDILAVTDGIVINHNHSSNIKKGMDLLQCFKA